MEKQRIRRRFFDIADWSFEMYRKLFFKIAGISILLHLPIYFLHYISEKFLIEGDEIVNESLLLLVWVIQIIFFLIVIPMLAGYITVKVYVDFTDCLTGNISSPKISFRELLLKLKSAVGYRIFFMFSFALCIWTAISVLFSLAFFVLGPRTLLQIVPFIELPVNIKFWDAFFSLLLYFGVFIWMSFLCIRWMFGYQGIFIENDKFFDALKRSFKISKGAVKLIVVNLIFVFSLQVWLLIAFLLFFLGLDVFANLSLELSLIASILTSLFYPLFIVIITMLYIYKKFDKDAVSLEFKMLKMMGKDQGQDYDRCAVQMPDFKFPKAEAEGEKIYKRAGLFNRFVSCFVDFGIAVVFVFIFEFFGWFFKGHNFMPDWSVWADTFGREYLYIYMLFFYVVAISFAHFVLNLVWSLILNGDTPGKRILGLVVLNEKGEKISKINILIREVFRLIDFFPVFYITGVLVMSISNNYRRLGDFVGKTYVVKKDIDKNEDKKEEKKQELNQFGCNQPSRIREFKLTKVEREVLSEFLERNDLENVRKEYFVSNLSIYFTLKYNIKENYGSSYDMLNDLLENSR